MNPAFELLGITQNADETEIKRAYALKLRSTRPDEDPSGFQRLNQAYKAALALARRDQGLRLDRASMHEAALPSDTSAPPGSATTHDAKKDVTGEASAMPPLRWQPPSPLSNPAGTPTNDMRRAQRQPVPVSPAPSRAHAATIQVDTFVDALCSAAGTCDEEGLRRWLHEQDALWSLKAKHFLGRALLQALTQFPRPIAQPNFDLLAEFFGFTDIFHGVDPVALLNVRGCCDSLWRLRPENRAGLAEFHLGRPSASHMQRTTRALRRLQHPLRRLDVIRAALSRTAVNDAASLARKLCPSGNPNLLPESIGRRQARFWIDAARTRPASLAYCEIVAWRYFAAVLLSPIFALFIAMLARNSGNPSGYGDLIWVGTISITLIILVIGLITFGMIGGAAVIRWILQLPQHPTARRWLYGVGTTLAASAAFVAMLHQPGAAIVAGSAGLWLTAWTYATSHLGSTASRALRIALRAILVIAVVLMLAGLGSVLLRENPRGQAPATGIGLLLFGGLLARSLKTSRRTRKR